MLDVDAARANSVRQAPLRPPEPALAITDDGLVLGRTVLAKMGISRAGGRGLVLDGQEERVLALLAVVDGKAVGSRVLDAIRRGSNSWSGGEPVLAAIALARTGLPPLDQPERTSIGLSAAERRLDDGLSPREPIKACGLDTVLLDVAKAGYNPNQPRVSAGNSDGGQWTNDGLAGDIHDSPSTARPATTAVIDGEGAGLSTSTVPPSGEPSAEGGIIFADYKL